MTGNLASIQYLRAIAAIIVVYFHTRVYLPGVPFELPRQFGFSGVDIFFVVSGFIIFMVTADNRDSIGTFFRKRIIRVAPLYWGATLAAVILFLLAPESFIKQNTSVMHVVMSLLFIPYPSPDGDGAAPFLKIGWTLIFEMYFYVVFGVLLVIRNANVRLIILTLFFSACIAYGQFVSSDGALLGYYTNPIVLEFLFGALIGALYINGQLKRLGLWLAICFAIAAATAILLCYEFGASHFGRVLALGVPAAILVTSFVAIEQHGKMPSFSRLSALGDASYSIYLAHPFVLTGIKLVVRKLGPWIQTPLNGFIVVVLSVCLATAFGYAVHRLIERPMLDILRRLFARRGSGEATREQLSGV